MTVIHVSNLCRLKKKKEKEKLKQVTVALPCITCQRKVIVCQNLADVLHFADRKGTVECGVTLVMVAWQYCL